MRIKNELNTADKNAITEKETDSHILESGQDDEVRRATIEAIPVKVKRNGLPVGVKADNPQGNKRVTARMMLFVDLVAQGASAREAYRKAYNCEKSTEASVIANANRLMRDARITKLLEPVLQAKKEMMLNDEIATRRHVMQELFKHSESNDVPISVRVRTLELMGKAVGMFVDKVESKVEEINVDSLKAELSTHLDLLNKVSH